MIKKFMVLLAMISLAVTTLADVVYLKNGDRLEGSVTGYDKKNVYFEMNNDKMIIFKSEIGPIVSDELLNINQNKTKYPNDFDFYSRYTPAPKQIFNEPEVFDSLAIQNDQIVVELQELNRNMRMTWIPMWVWSVISLGCFVYVVGQ